MLFDWNGRKNKTIRGLFDNNLETKMNLNVTNEDAFILPYRGFVVLNNIYNNFRIDYYDKYGSGNILTVKLYSSTKTLLGSFTMTTESFDSWKTISGTDGFSDVRFVEVSADNGTDFDSGIYELKLYGDVVSAAPSIWLGTAVSPVPDPGKYGHGVNILDDRFKRKDGPSGAGDNIFLKVARAARVGFEATKWDFYPNHYTDPADGLMWLGRNGSDNLGRRIKDVTGPNNIEVQMYRNGGSIANLSAGTANNNTGYIPDANNFFRIVSGGNKALAATWAPLKKLYYKLIALFGSNASADMTGITVTGASGADIATGQGMFKYFENGNEDNKDWVGAASYLTPEESLEKLIVVGNEALLADPNALVLDYSKTFLDNTYFRAMGFINYWKYDSAPLPIYGFCFNLYMNSDLDGQGGSGTGVSPETYNLRARLIEFQQQMDEMFPNKRVFWAEFGTAADPSSPWYIAAQGGRTARETCAYVALRQKAICRSLRFIPKMYYYAFFEDSSYPFNSMAITQDHFNPDPENSYYINTTVFPIGYALANELYIEENYNWFATHLLDGGTTGQWLQRLDHVTDPNKKLFKTWKGSLNGSSLGSQTIDVGANAVSATLYTLQYDQWTPASSPLTITGTTVSVTVNEEIKWIEVTYSGAAPAAPVIRNRRFRRIR